VDVCLFHGLSWEPHLVEQGSPHGADGVLVHHAVSCVPCGCTHHLLPCFPHATLHLLPEAGATEEQRREAGRCRAVVGAPGLPEPRQESTGLGHQACSGRIVLDGAPHADRDRSTWACWGVAGTGPEAGSIAVVTPPWTSRRHGGAPETHAVARWATVAGRPRHRHPCRHRTHTLRHKQGPSTHLTSACHHLSRCGDHDPMCDPASMRALPDVVCQAVNTHRCSGGWHRGPPTQAGGSRPRARARCRSVRCCSRRRYAPAHAGCPRLPAVCWSPLPSSPAGS
jgi:hypothetical protein